jgi:hypothetical protein
MNQIEQDQSNEGAPTTLNFADEVTDDVLLRAAGNVAALTTDDSCGANKTVFCCPTKKAAPYSNDCK